MEKRNNIFLILTFALCLMTPLFSSSNSSNSGSKKLETSSVPKAYYSSICLVDGREFTDLAAFTWVYGGHGQLDEMIAHASISVSSSLGCSSYSRSSTEEGQNWQEISVPSGYTSCSYELVTDVGDNIGTAIAAVYWLWQPIESLP